MRIVALLCLVLVSDVVFGQLQMPEIDPEEGKEQCEALCSPGVLGSSRSRGIEFAYNSFGGAPVRPEEGEWSQQAGYLESLQSIVVDFKAPLLLKPKLKIIFNYDHEPETYFFSHVPTINNFSALSPSFGDMFNDLHTRRLKNNGLGLIFLRPFDDQHYGVLRLKAGFRGDYNGWINFGQRYASYSLSALYGVKKSPNKEWGVGLNFTHNFNRTLAVPFFMYNRTFNEKWGLEAVFPAYVQGRFNIDKNTILLFGPEFESQSYSIDVENSFTQRESIYHFSHSELRTGFSLERQVVPWVWFNVKGGFQFNFQTQFDATAPGAASFTATPDNAFYLRLGFFISPPDRN